MTRNGFTQIFKSAKPRLTKWHRPGSGTITETPTGFVAHREYPSRLLSPYLPFDTWSEAVLWLEGKQAT